MPAAGGVQPRRRWVTGHSGGVLGCLHFSLRVRFIGAHGPLPHVSLPAGGDCSPFSAKTKAPRISEGLQKLDPERLVDVTLVYTFPLFMGEQLEPREIKDCLQCARSLCCITNSHSTVDADSTRLLAQFPWVRSLTLT